MQWLEGTITDTTEIIDIDNKTHQCVDSAPPLPYPLMLAMGGLLHDKYPLICGGNIGPIFLYDYGVILLSFKLRLK